MVARGGRGRAPPPPPPLGHPPAITTATFSPLWFSCFLFTNTTTGPTEQ